MAGWQFCYVIFGLIGIVLGVAIYFFLPDWPDSPPSRRQFLTPEEAAFMAARLPPNSSRSSDANIEWAVIKRDLKGGLVCEFLHASKTNSRVFWLLDDAFEHRHDWSHLLAAHRRPVVRLGRA
jgi:hypothetical protein